MKRYIILFVAGALLILLAHFSFWIVLDSIAISDKIYISFDKWRYWNSKFDSQTFASGDLKYRNVVADEVLKNYLKKGMSDAAVRKLLGTPDCVSEFHDGATNTNQVYWGYQACPLGSNWTSDSISIVFSSEHKLLGAGYFSVYNRPAPNKALQLTPSRDMLPLTTVPPLR